jgi:polyhydroxybutyrate depolymerase
MGVLSAIFAAFQVLFPVGGQQDPDHLPPITAAPSVRLAERGVVLAAAGSQPNSAKARWIDSKARKEPRKKAIPLLPRPTTLTVKVDGVERSALVYPGLKAHAATSPVLLYFHGFTGTSKDSADRTRFHELWPQATVVYPQGLKTEHGKGNVAYGWQDDRHGPWHQDNKDVRFVDQLLQELSARCRIDPRCIYASGHSNGGLFSFLLLVQRPERFAAFAPVGCYGACVREATTPRPVLFIFGEKDKVFDISLAKDTLGRLLSLNRCNTERKKEWLDGCQMFVPDQGGKPVIWWLHGGGHAWPGSASELVVRFFQQQALDTAGDVPPQRPDATGQRVLLAKDASSITGSLRYHTDLGFIGWWSDPDSTVTWKVGDLRLGDYDVYVDYASPGYGGRYSLSFGKNRLQAEATDTGGWRAYRKKYVGKVTIESRAVNVVIKAVEIVGTALMDVRAVTLVPAN